MTTVSSYEAKTHLSGLLKRAKEGERITITRHGVSVAVLIPAGSPEKGNVGESIRRIREFRAKHTLGNMSLRDMIEEGRRV